jgi:hypothetical protein
MENRPLNLNSLTVVLTIHSMLQWMMVRRKVALDRELNKIEQDIEKFSHENIHIKLV